MKSLINYIKPIFEKLGEFLFGSQYEYSDKLTIIENRIMNRIKDEYGYNHKNICLLNPEIYKK